MWTDSHCHLETLPEGAIREARNAGVGHMVTPGVSGLDPAAVRLSQQDDQIHIAAGWHPLYLNITPNEMDGQLNHILDQTPGVAAIGEIGLDYWETDRHARTQQDALRVQLEIARTRHLPVLIHLRKGFDDFLSIVREFSGVRYVMHMYGGSAEYARQLLKLLDDVRFSFGGPATRKNARHAHETLRLLPIDRILLETDAPDLPPPGMSTPNVPANLPVIGNRIAEILNMPVEELARQTTTNAREVFQWNDLNG